MKKIMFSSLLVFLLSSFGANAAFIEGSILFGGFTWAKDGTTVTVSNPSVFLATGDLSGQTTVAISPLDYSPFATVDPLWSTNGGEFEFEITSVTVTSETTAPDTLVLTGSGILTSTLAGLDATVGTWDFSGSTINWSSATAVPVPAAVWLFGTAILGLVGMRRKGKLEVSPAAA